MELLGDMGQGPSPLWASVSPLGLEVFEGHALPGSLLWEHWTASPQDEWLEFPALSPHPRDGPQGPGCPTPQAPGSFQRTGRHPSLVPDTQAAHLHM